ncbi:telomeric repeat binding factor a [Erpetoichthys calabaricus]|uniref:Telomeric repeat-binding factor n=1 Tax=Erpetoichthys calabaricus TaxID=27687 RepID=A0A8C4TAL3_ERPCA|nr:telomeric repeat binding factor a [Erpetoichthys calabaricus]
MAGRNDEEGVSNAVSGDAARSSTPANVECPTWSPECIVRHWVFDFYFYLGLKAFENGEHDDFCQIRDVIQGMLCQPLRLEEYVTKKLRVLQLLSRINEGQNLDCIFEIDEQTPLESALNILKMTCEEVALPKAEIDNAKRLVRKMAVIVCIQQNNFEKAQNILKKHFPPGQDLQKAEFMDLIQQKNNSHPSLEEMTYEHFREKMYRFCQTIITVSEPILLKIAKNHLAKHSSEENSNIDQVNETEERVQEEVNCSLAGESSCSLNKRESSKWTTFGRSALKVAFCTLSKMKQATIQFSRLEETDLEPSSGEILVNRNSGSVPNGTNVQTVSRLVIEPDSQTENESVESQSELQEVNQKSSTPPHSEPTQKLFTRQKRSHPPIVSNSSEDSDESIECLNFTVQKPIKRESKSRWKRSCPEGREHWSDEDSLFSVKTRSSKANNRLGSDTDSIYGHGSRKHKWTVEETEWIKQGVSKFGEGNWKTIMINFPFEGRTAVSIKDRWRTMKKLKIVD